MLESNLHHVFVKVSTDYSKFFLLSKITPIIATSNKTEIISNGRVYEWNNNWPSENVSPS